MCAPEGSVEFVAKMTEGKGRKEVEVWEGFEHSMLGFGFNGLDEEHEKMVSPRARVPPRNGVVLAWLTRLVLM